MRDVDNAVVPRGRLFPAFVQGGGIGVAIGIWASDMGQFPEIVALLVAMLAVTYSYLRDRNIRQEASTNGA